MYSSGGFRLVVRRGPQPNQVYELNKDIISIGRDITNEITINDPEVSRHHCRLTRGPNDYTLEDLGSTNGTFVNGQRLTGARPLKQGDLVGMGETVTLAYETSIAASPQAPPSPAPYGSPESYGASTSPPGAPAASTSSQPAADYYGGQQAGGYYGGQPVVYPQAQQPPPAYTYADQSVARGNRGCGLFIGCAIFVVLGAILLVVGIIFVDSPLDDIPGVSHGVNAIPLPGGSVDNGEKFMDALLSCKIDTAKDYVCSDEQESITRLGRSCQAANVKEITCEQKGSDLLCSFTVEAGGQNTSTAVMLNVRNGKMCGFVNSFAPSQGD